MKKIISIVISISIIIGNSMPIISYAENNNINIENTIISSEDGVNIDGNLGIKDEDTLSSEEESLENEEIPNIESEYKDIEKEIVEVEKVAEDLFGSRYNKIKKPVPRAMMVNEVYVPEEYINDINELSNITYLEKKTDTKYEVAISHSNGEYSYVEDADDLSQAIEIAMDSKSKYSFSSDSVPIVIDGNGQIVYATSAMGRIIKHINGQPYNKNDINTDIYTTESKTNAYTYINHGYIDDVPVIEDRGNVAKIEVSGYTGWINKDTTQSEYDLIIVPMNQVKNPSYYSVSNGQLTYFISSNIESNSASGYSIKIGPAPSFMQSGVKYYSYDSNYFYTSLDTLISDTKSNNHNNSINSSNPYHSYYKYIPFRSKTSLNADEINLFIENNTKDKANSKLKGMGDALINAQEKYGVNALMILGVAINESAWGTSKIAQEKNNLFGINAVDSNTGNANTFNTVQDCINTFALNYISKGYSDPQDWRYYGSNLGNKKGGANVKYASDPFWGEKAARYIFQADYEISGSSISRLKEHNNYQLAMYTSQTDVKDKNRSTLYSVYSNRKTNSGQVEDPVIISSQETYRGANDSWYQINPDRTTNVNNGEFSGSYNWSEKGYINTQSVKFINDGRYGDGSGIEQGIVYQTHVQDYGWQTWKNNGKTSGTTQEAKRLEGIKIKVNDYEGMSIEYRTHVEDYGWQPWKKNGQMSGTTGEGKRLEAIQIELLDAPEGYHVEYRTHVENYGWQPWQRDGKISGTMGEAKRLEAIEIRIVKEDNNGISYQSHVEEHGWQSWRTNGVMSGTQGEAKHLEAVKIKLNNLSGVEGIRYKTHVADYGWLEWKRDGELSGTVGKNKQIEAIQIELINNPSNYNVEYRVHIEDYGWQPWKKNGEIAGTTGENKQVEAIEMRILKN